MSGVDKETYVKEESFGVIDSGFYDFKVESELEDVRIIASPEKFVVVSSEGAEKTFSNILHGAREVVRDLSRYMEITFTDVYALNISEEGWEDWKWGASDTPKLQESKLGKVVYPIVRVENSAWKDRIFPEWNRDWMDQVSHWRLISITNCVDILARSAKGESRKGD